MFFTSTRFAVKSCHLVLDWLLFQFQVSVSKLKGEIDTLRNKWRRWRGCRNKEKKEEMRSRDKYEEEEEKLMQEWGNTEYFFKHFFFFFQILCYNFFFFFFFKILIQNLFGRKILRVFLIGLEGVPIFSLRVNK